MPANFLQDLGEGIFTRLGELRNEQMARDDKQKMQTLSALSSIFDQLEPDSKSALMPLIGKTIGIQEKYAPKGLKGLWEALSGYPNKSVENQLGDIMREASGMFMAPSQARGIRQKADVARMFGAESPFSNMVPGPQARNRAAAVDAERGLQGKLIFRDQRTEELEKIRERAEAQAILQSDRLNLQNWYKDKSREDTQAHQLELEDERAMNRAKQKVMNYAWILAKQRGFVEPTPALEAEAGLYLMNKGDADLTYIKQRTNLAKSQAYLADMQANAIKEGRALTSGEASFANLTERQFGSAEDAFGSYTKSAAGVAEQKKRMEEALATLNAAVRSGDQPGAYYDPTSKTVKGINAKPGAPPGEAETLAKGMLMIGGAPAALKAYSDAASEYEKQNRLLSGQKEMLRGHGKFIQWDPATGEPVKAIRGTAPNKDQYGFIPGQGDNVIRNQPQGRYYMNQDIQTPSGWKKIIRVEPNPDGTFNYYVGSARK